MVEREVLVQWISSSPKVERKGHGETDSGEEDENSA